MVEKLVDKLKRPSQSLEDTLNTKMVLSELAVNGFKAVLANETHLEVIFKAACQEDSPHTKQLLQTIISQDINSRNDDFKRVFAAHFTDLVYSLCLSI